MAVAQNDLTNDAYYAAGTFENSRKYRGYSAVAALPELPDCGDARIPALKAWTICKGKQSVSVRRIRYGIKC